MDTPTPSPRPPRRRIALAAGLALRPAAAGLAGLLALGCGALALAGAGPATGAASPAADPAGVVASLFFSADAKTASSDVAVAADGSLHVVFSQFLAQTDGPRMFYGTCAQGASGCGRIEDWRLADIGAGVSRMQVETTPDGRPRVLVQRSGAEGGADEILYGECDAGCGASEGWRLTRIATSDLGPLVAFEGEGSQHTFVLDGEGRPRFVYSDRNYSVEPDHYGTFYMACDAGCTDRGNWTETDIARHAAYDTEVFDEPALALTTDGRPRLVARVFAFDEAGADAPDGLYLLGCDRNCGETASWRRHFLVDTGSGSFPSPGWDLALGPDDRPRLAVFTGEGMEQEDIDNQLVYYACVEGDCFADAGWAGTIIGAGAGRGEDPSLDLDGQGRPRLAFITDGNLGFAACDADCHGETAVWRIAALETDAELRRQYEEILPFTCDTSLWQVDAPRLTVAPEGGAGSIAYDVSIEGRCWSESQDPTDTRDYFEFNTIWRGAHWTAFEAAGS